MEEYRGTIDTYGNEGAKLVQDVDVFKCANCGSGLEFKPETGKLFCEHCNSQQDIPVDRNVQAAPVDFSLDKATKWASETRTFKCESCGATVTFDNAEFAAECPYCGGKKVLKIEQFDGIRPGALLPFVLNVAQAFAAYFKWLKKKLFAPRKMKKEAAVEKVKGVYCPCWAFDSNTYSSYNGVVGKYYYVTVGVGKNRHQERRIRWYPVSGRLNRNFNNVLIEASPHLNQKDFNALKPFPMQEAVVYDRRFLSGFFADHYDRGLKEGWDLGANMMKQEIYNQIKRSLNCDVVKYLNVNTNFADSKFKHTLLPVYVCNSKWKEKVYNFFVNGRSGKVTGKTPVSVGKVLIAVGIGLLVVGGIIALAALSL